MNIFVKIQEFNSLTYPQVLIRVLWFTKDHIHTDSEVSFIQNRKADKMVLLLQTVYDISTKRRLKTHYLSIEKTYKSCVFILGSLFVGQYIFILGGFNKLDNCLKYFCWYDGFRKIQDFGSNIRKISM